MIFHHGTELILILIFKLILLISIVQLSIQIFNCALQYDLNTNIKKKKKKYKCNCKFKYINTSKNIKICIYQKASILTL